MAEAEKVMCVSADDIEKIMGVSKDDIEKIMGVEIPSGVAWGGTRAVIMGGRVMYNSSVDVSTTAIQYKSITSDGNTSDFGNLTVQRHAAKGSGSNVTRALMASGGSDTGGSFTWNDTIDYVTVGSTGNASDFGNVDNDMGYGGRDGASNGTLCFLNGGNDGTLNDDMEYITIASTGNGTDAGDLTQGKNSQATSNADTKYLIVGGYSGSGYALTEVDTHSFHTSNNATDYGNVSSFAVYNTGIASSQTRVVCAGGFTATGSWTRGNEIHYFPVASSADSTDAANMTTINAGSSGTSDATRGEFYGGQDHNAFFLNRIQKITIASISDAEDIGDLSDNINGSNSQGEVNMNMSASSQTGT